MLGIRAAALNIEAVLDRASAGETEPLGHAATGRTREELGWPIHGGGDPRGAGGLRRERGRCGPGSG